MADSEPTPGTQEVSFADTASAFAHLSDRELNYSYWMFRLMNSPFFVKVSTTMALWSMKLHLPVKALIKATIYKQFCGGESIQDSQPVIDQLVNSGIGAILDYSVEGNEKEEDFDSTTKELLHVLEVARDNPGIPIGCMKVTGIGRFGLLEKVSEGGDLTQEERLEYARVIQRLEKLCKAAHDYEVPIYIDAEESWIQVAIDRLAESMMRKFNRKRAIVFTTLQMYRHDRLAYFEKLIGEARREQFILGVKMVRGAYLEKENKRAQEKGYPTPMQPSKPATDGDYNAGLKLAMDNLDTLEICAGSHNEESCLLLVQLLGEKQLPPNDPRVYFSQLYGMSDYMSYNLAKSGYNITKYLPYGPVKAAVPYLIRRAQENTSIAGQMGKELKMISTERKRRKQSKSK